MIEKITKSKIYIIALLVIIMLSTLFLGINYLMKNKNNKSLPEVKLREINKTQMFAIMVQNGDEYEEYKSDDNKWPGKLYEFKEAKCVNDNGDLIEKAVTFVNGKATLTTNQTMYCTLYFDKIDPTKDLREKDTQGYLSTNLQGGMYRYQASPADANEAAQMTNWICFGTSENCGANNDLVDKYMYRIIGITEEGEMYLIKETFVKEGSNKSFAWNDKYRIDSGESLCPDGKCPEWNEADLFYRLNGKSNGSIQGTGTCYPTCNEANTDIFVDNSEYSYLKSGDSNGGEAPSDWYNLIADHNWMYGDTNIDQSAEETYTGDAMYAIETGNTATSHYVQQPEGSTNVVEAPYTWYKSINDKISLMYVHDYAYSYYDGKDPATRGKPKNYETAKKSWIFFQKDGYNTSPGYEWLGSRWGVAGLTNYSLVARSILNSGYVGHNYFYYEFGVRPVFYLKSEAKIIDGNGTKNDPFILEI